MSEKEKATIDRLCQNFDKMGDFQKGFIVGYAERISDDRLIEDRDKPAEQQPDEAE